MEHIARAYNSSVSLFEGNSKSSECVVYCTSATTSFEVITIIFYTHF